MNRNRQKKKRLIDIGERCFINMEKIEKIDFNPSNPKYRIFDNKIIISKSSFESNEFDCLVFCLPKVETIKIPSFIKHINFFAFVECKNNLKMLKFQQILN